MGFFSNLFGADDAQRKSIDVSSSPSSPFNDGVKREFKYTRLMAGGNSYHTDKIGTLRFTVNSNGTHNASLEMKGNVKSFSKISDWKKIPGPSGGSAHIGVFQDSSMGKVTIILDPLKQVQLQMDDNTSLYLIK